MKIRKFAFHSRNYNYVITDSQRILVSSVNFLEPAPNAVSLNSAAKFCAHSNSEPVCRAAVFPAIYDGVLRRRTFAFVIEPLELVILF